MAHTYVAMGNNHAHTQSSDVNLRPKKRLKESDSKRAPYTVSACDSCHGRKLKCSGDRPCLRCNKQQIPCSYPREHEKATSSIAPEEVVKMAGEKVVSETLFISLEELQYQLDEFKHKLRHVTFTSSASVPFKEIRTSQLTPSQQTDDLISEANSVRASIAGPTSFAFSMDRADARLLTVSSSAEDRQTSGSRIPEENVDYNNLNCALPQHSAASNDSIKTSLEEFTPNQVVECLEIFQNVFGILHPLPHIEKLKSNTGVLLRSLKRSLWSRPVIPGQCGLLEMLKIVIAIALVTQAGCQTSLAENLSQSVQMVIQDAAYCRNISHDFRVLLLLVAIYHCCNDDLVLGSRVLLFAERTAVEDGLYQREKLEMTIQDSQERQSVINLLWSLFVLDRQFNFAAGLPHTLDDSAIDLPPPVGAPYLSAMVNYVKFGAQAWNSIVNRDALASGRGPSKESINFFRYQVQQWHQELDAEVRFNAVSIESDDTFFTEIRNKDDTYFKILLYLRCNQIQILVLRPLLIHSLTAKNNSALVIEVVSIARKSIRALQSLVTKTDLYQQRQMIFNHFLSSALAVLFLAAACDAENSRRAVDTGSTVPLLAANDELQVGLDLIETSSINSESSRRLCKTFSRPKQQLTRLGLLGAINPISRNLSSPSVLLQGNRNVDWHNNFGLNDATAENSFLWLNWLDDTFPDASASFGMPSWM